MSAARKNLLVIGLLISAAATALGAWAAYGLIRPIDFLAIFGGGLGFGMCFVVWVRSPRDVSARPPPPIVPKSGA